MELKFKTDRLYDPFIAEIIEKGNDFSSGKERAVLDYLEEKKMDARSASEEYLALANKLQRFSRIGSRIRVTQGVQFSPLSNPFTSTEIKAKAVGKIFIDNGTTPEYREVIRVAMKDGWQMGIEYAAMFQRTGFKFLYRGITHEGTVVTPEEFEYGWKNLISQSEKPTDIRLRGEHSTSDERKLEISLGINILKYSGLTGKYGDYIRELLGKTPQNLGVIIK